jgi:hypothetical protein
MVTYPCQSQKHSLHAVLAHDDTLAVTRVAPLCHCPAPFLVVGDLRLPDSAAITARCSCQ